MKILMFGWEFPPHISGGLGTACFGMTKSLAKLGIEIDFVLPKTSSQEKTHLNIIDANSVYTGIYKDTNEIYKENNINKIKIDSILTPYLREDTYQNQKEILYKEEKNREQIGQKKYSFTGKYGKNLLEEVFRMTEIAKTLSQNLTYDLIHAHDWMTFPAAIAAKHQSKLPLIIHVHATEFDRSGDSVNPQIYEIERSGMENADLIIAVSQRTKDIIINKYLINPSKIDVVHNAVDKDDDLNLNFKKHLKEKIVLFLGRVTSQKGPFYFIDAANIVRQHCKNLRFVMAGTGDLLSKCIKRTAELKMQDYFHFTGFLKGEQLKQIFNISDLLVMPSVSEPFGIVPFEAIRYGLPVIISKQSGIAEVLEHAVKVDFWDTEKLASEIIKILNNGNEAKEMIHNNQETLSKIHWDNVARKINDIYHRVAK